MQLDEYYGDLMNLVHTNAELDRDYLANAFMTEVGRRLEEAEEVDHLEVLSFDGLGQHNRRLMVNGYDLDDSDGSVALAVLDFENTADVPRTVATADARRRFAALLAFLEESVNGDFLEGREESAAEYQLARELRGRGATVTRYRLYLITNGVMGERVKGFPSTTLGGVGVDFHVWDIRRLMQVAESVQGREALEIDLTEWAPQGLPVLEVADQDTEFRTFLTAVPAAVVAELYGRYGSRLLEGNVRSYLSNRGKVNKGIRTTVLRDPAHFLAYNNGITATATAVVKRGENAIVGLTDLQIVNGGQTAASLFYVSRDERPRPDLRNVYVQMKLVVVKPDVAVEMVPQISRSANSQNRVSEADFFSNSPFHVRLEELSRRLLVPAQAGANYQTKWFYERTRGQYQNEKNKLSAASQKKFEAQYPRPQVMTKTDAARYEVSWLMQPHQVSAGAQKNFIAFADAVAKRWSTSDEQFNELYFKHLVAKGILYNRVRQAISHADWYESGYLANIVTYTVAKLAYEVERSGPSHRFDFDRVWTNQDISPATAAQCVAIGEEVLSALTDRRRTVTNVTEWAKRPQCWDSVKRLRVDLRGDLLEELSDRHAHVQRMREAQANQRIDTSIQAQAKLLEITPEQWSDLRRFALANRLAAPADVSLVDIMLSSKLTVPTERQSTRLLTLIKKAEDNGMLW